MKTLVKFKRIQHLRDGIFKNDHTTMHTTFDRRTLSCTQCVGRPYMLKLKKFRIPQFPVDRPHRIKTDGAKWVSKYARGGSARTFSAREGYIVVDAVLGHLASNGLAALPQRKAQKVREDIARTYGFLNEKK